MGAIGKSQGVWAVIVACGKSEQLADDVDTAFLQLGNQPILTYSLLAFERCSDVDGILVVTTKERVDSVVGMSRLFGAPKLKKIVVGGVQKVVSLKAALSALEEENPAIVMVHEASQPCIHTELIEDCIKSARRYGVAVAAEKINAPSTLVPKGLKAGKVMPPDQVWSMQMPIAAKRELLEKALGLKGSKAKVDDNSFNAKLLAGAYLVATNYPNIQVRALSDIQLLATALRV